MNCSRCGIKLTGKADTFGETDETYCGDHYFELVELRVELTDATSEWKDALTKLAALRAYNCTVTKELRKSTQNVRCDANRLEKDCEIIAVAIEKFNRYEDKK